MRPSFVLIIAGIFLVLTGIFYTLQVTVPAYRFSVLMGGNIIMALVVLLSYGVVRKQIAERPQAFVRGVYGANLLKLMICLVSFLIYALLDRKNIHIPSLFILFGIYAVYTAAETWYLTKLAKGVK